MPRMSICLTFIVASGLALAGNLLPNGSFEKKTEEGGAEGWTKPRGGYAFEEGSGRSFTRALAFNVTSNTPYLFPECSVPGEASTRYRASVFVRADKLSGGARIGLQFSDKNHKWLNGFYLPQSVTDTKGEWKKVEVSGVSPAGAAYVSVACYVMQGSHGRVWFDDATLEEESQQLIWSFTSSAYRDTAANGQVTFNGVLRFSEEDLKEKGVAAACLDVPSISGAARTVRAAIVNGAFSATVDVAGLPLGEFPVVARLEDAKGRNLGSRTLPFTRVAKLPPRRVMFDAAGRTLVNGKRFFPLGIYVGGNDPKSLDELKGSAFNCAICYKTIQNRKTLDEYAKRGLMVLPSVIRYRGGPVVADLAEIRQIMEPLQDHPAVLAWYMNDELSCFDALREHRDFIARVDPDHPAYSVQYQIEDMRDYMGTFDVIGTDPYPVPGKPIGMVTEWTEKTRRATFGAPMWQVTQIFDPNGYGKKLEESRAPTEAEMRNMNWQAIAAGANGIFLWAHFALHKQEWRDPYEKRWQEVMRVADEIAARFDVLNGDDVPVTISKGREAVVARAFKPADGTWLLVVNRGEEPASATVEVNGLKQDVALPALGVRFEKIGR